MMHAIPGTNIIHHLMNVGSSKSGFLSIIKRANPLDILSTKLYIPNTNAPLAPLTPITSDIRLILVLRVIAYANPIRIAIKYIIFLV